MSQKDRDTHLQIVNCFYTLVMKYKWPLTGSVLYPILQSKIRDKSKEEMAFGNIYAMMTAHHHIGILKIEEAELDIYFIDLNNGIYNIVFKKRIQVCLRNCTGIEWHEKKCQNPGKKCIVSVNNKEKSEI